MININLSKEEEIILQNYFSKSPIKLLRLKSQCILMRNKGMKYLDMEYYLSRKQRVLKMWVVKFNKTRISSIFTGHINNENASKLTKTQRLEIKNILSFPPSEYGLPKDFWDVPNLKSYLKAEYGIVYESKQSYHHILRFSNLSFKLPDKFDIKRDEKEVLRKTQLIRKQVTKYLQYSECEIFTSDESRIEQEALTRRAWIKKGLKTVIEVIRTKDYQNYIGFLNQRTGKAHLYQLKWQNQQEIIKSINLLQKQYPNKRIIIVWDNAGFHKGKLIKEQLKTGKSLQNIHLINFPPYAPDKNPTEHIWKYAKDKLSNIQRTTFEETKTKFESIIRKKKFSYTI